MDIEIFEFGAHVKILLEEIVGCVRKLWQDELVLANVADC